MPSVYIETFGCQMNEADSRYIAGRALASGYEMTADPASASVVVLNTCTVRDNAERRAYGRMAHFKALKGADPAIKLVVCGCLAEQDCDDMRARVPYLDGIFGTRELGRLGDELERWRDGFGDDAGLAYADERALLAQFGGSADCVGDPFAFARAYVNVQRGCSYYCTYCIVPHVRGRFDNRPAADILAECERAIASGARQVTLVGQTVNAFRDTATGGDFADLLRAVAELPGLDRLTFLTSHPKDYVPKLALAMGELGARGVLEPRFHLPLQCGSDPVLRRMNRKYTIAQYRDKIATFREQCPDWSLTTDLIVGFPGESDDDFARTVACCDEFGFAQAFAFVYSARRGTPAALWPQVSPDVASERHRLLMVAVDRNVRAWHAPKVGRVERALVQGRSRKDRSRIAAKTGDNVTVVAPLRDLDETTLRERPWIDVRVESAHTWGVTGEIVGIAARFDAPARAVATRTIDLIGAR